MNNILAIDSATQVLSITLKHDIKYFYKEIEDGFNHSENILPSISELLNKANIDVSLLDLLVCTRGPGSFTGLRISMATLKGFSTALNIPLVSIPTLDLYAENCGEKSGIVMPVIDARKKSFYTAIYENNSKITKDLDLNMDQIIDITNKFDKVILTGNDAEILYSKLNNKDKFDVVNGNNLSLTHNLIDLGILMYNKYGSDSKDQGPLYIRKSEAEILMDKKKSE
ncbi:MAG: tRNA (adenosine(37)-N6)-threonylcarbamoyltransferase complex dimerization subunit type 1 TsaB [Spirochaetales bacterium]|nr:tRNA (adenosine(37)-N6)-threonylcarbamoyltransferase complex dimerization subunit type 1 TsaB [Spirochaetales bacterium]